MNIALAQLNYTVGDFAANTPKIIQAIADAKANGADLIVFAELAVGGYLAKDLLRSEAFIRECEQSIANIAAACQGIACIIGAPVRNADGKGKALYNAALLMEDGAVKAVRHKTLLPDYDVFNENRYFESNRAFSCITVKGRTVALTICEDLWNDDKDNSYVDELTKALYAEQPELIINIAASPFSYAQHQQRLAVLQRNARAAKAPLLYVNQVGAHMDILFDGRSLALDKDGQQLIELPKFAEQISYVSIFDAEPIAAAPDDSEIALIHQALIFGLRDYFQKSGFKKAILGLSGGLDSALVAALACEALGPENVLSILMPSVYSTDHSIKDALDLVANTGSPHQIIPIKDIFTAFEQTLAPSFEGYEPNVAEENIQARTRGTLLMALSNKLGHILLNTSNKSEAAVGYGTLYGDMAGSLSVIGDVYKTQAYELARYINRDREIIPVNTIVKPPSAELRPDQKDADSLPEYDLLDGILYQLIELEKTGSEVVKLGFDAATVERVTKLLNGAEFKRFQAPPTLRVSPKGFGAGRQMPLVAKYPF